MLPKIHKTNNPGRSIISGNGTLTEMISGLVEGVLKLYASSSNSYIQDITDFLKKLESVGDPPDDTILATMDVKSLYTKIPHEARLQAIRCSLPPNDTSIVTESLTEFILEHN